MQTVTITSRPEMDKIIASCQVCYLGMSDQDGLPYVLPFNFGYDGEYIWLHSGPTGKKMEILKNRPDVCLAFSTDHELYHQHEQVACSYGMKYKSVLVFGKVEWIEPAEKKIEGLNIIMKNYANREFSYSKPSVDNVAVFRVKPENMTAKKRGL